MTFETLLIQLVGFYILLHMLAWLTALICEWLWMVVVAKELLFFLSYTFPKSKYLHLPKGVYIESLEYISMQKQVNRIWNAWLNCCPSAGRDQS